MAQGQCYATLHYIVFTVHVIRVRHMHGFCQVSKQVL